jgi:thiamine biosynthesis lipoprotein
MRRRTFIKLLALGSVAGCARPDQTTIHGLTMGTRYNVELAAPLDDAARQRLKERIDAELLAINRSMSTYDPQSELSAFNRRQDLHWTPASPGLLEVLGTGSQISRASQGAFDVTVGPLVDLWGFGPEYRPRQVPDDAVIEQARQSVGYQHLHVDTAAAAIRKTDGRIQVDVCAIAKGYGVDRVAMVLDRAGVSDYLVEIGGELRARGNRAAGGPWRVGIERPVEGGHVLGEVVAIKNRSIATSGTTEDFFEQAGRHYPHIIDPKSGRPVEHGAIAVSVVADTSMEADAWATALVVHGPQRGYELAKSRGLAAMFVTPSGSKFDVHVTDAFRAHLVS